MRGMSLIFAPFLAIILLVSSSFAQTTTGYQPGDEADIFGGHTFTENNWYTTVENQTKENDTAEFGVSFVNMGDIEAFLITLNKVTDEEGNMGTLPYQMFGMHYFNEAGREIFVGALLAFLCVYNDTNADDVPTPGENFFYVIPFGLGNVINGTYPPTVSNHGVTKISDTHYQLGITYTNLYAIASENPLLSAQLLTGWVLQFSELTITYNIEVDTETGELTAETYYTVGQINTLFAVLLGIPIPMNDIQKTIPDNFGLGAVHFTTVFTSNYKLLGPNGNQLNTNQNQKTEGTIEIQAGDKRAFSVGLRGDYDLIDESDDTVIGDDLDAVNMIMKARLTDLILVGWQLGFSANVFAHMAYGLSEQIRANWATPGLLAADSTKAIGPKGFGAQAFWYGVFFPGWDGYRVVHDPVYTAYFAPPPENPIVDDDEQTPGFEMFLILGALIAVPVIKWVGSRKK